MARQGAPSGAPPSHSHGTDCRSSIQSEYPSALLPGGVNVELPVFENGDPDPVVNTPLLGSYQRAWT